MTRMLAGSRDRATGNPSREPLWHSFPGHRSKKEPRSLHVPPWQGGAAPRGSFSFHPVSSRSRTCPDKRKVEEAHLESRAQSASLTPEVVRLALTSLTQTSFRSYFSAEKQNRDLEVQKRRRRLKEHVSATVAAALDRGTPRAASCYVERQHSVPRGGARAWRGASMPTRGRSGTTTTTTTLHIFRLEVYVQSSLMSVTSVCRAALSKRDICRGRAFTLTRDQTTVSILSPPSPSRLLCGLARPSSAQCTP